MAPRVLGSWEARAMSLNRTTHAAGPGRTPRMACCVACRQEMPSSTLMHVHRWRERCPNRAVPASDTAAETPPRYSPAS